MTLPTDIKDREMRKFVEDGSGDVAVRTSLTVGDIEIGKVEIKNATDDTTAVVKTDGTNNALVVTQNSQPLPTGASTSANQQPPSTTPTVYNVTLTLANTEYSQALPANTREFRFRCRTIYDVRYAFVTGKVATPTTPYLTLHAGLDYFSDYNNLTSQTLYLASATAGVVVEVEVWT